MTRTAKLEAELSDAIALVHAEMRWCFSSRPSRKSPHADERAAHERAVRSYIRAIRIMRAMEAADEDAAIEAQYPHSGGEW